MGGVIDHGCGERKFQAVEAMGEWVWSWYVGPWCIFQEKMGCGEGQGGEYLNFQFFFSQTNVYAQKF